MSATEAGPDKNGSEHDASFCTIPEAIEDFRMGRMVLIVDDEDRENEGDLTLAAQFATPEVINFMAQHGRGLICKPMLGDRLDQLQIPLMVARDGPSQSTAGAVSSSARSSPRTRSGRSAVGPETTTVTRWRNGG